MALPDPLYFMFGGESLPQLAETLLFRDGWFRLLRHGAGTVRLHGDAIDGLSAVCGGGF